MMEVKLDAYTARAYSLAWLYDMRSAIKIIPFVHIDQWGFLEANKCKHCIHTKLRIRCNWSTRHIVVQVKLSIILIKSFAQVKYSLLHIYTQISGSVPLSIQRY